MIGSRRAGSILRWLLVMAVGLACNLAVFATPAAASNLSATDGRASIQRVDPAGVVSVGVIGGDAALRVIASPGHEVVVLGYEMEPYLRIAADGHTAVNLHSPARTLNRTRNGSSGGGTADAGVEPEWIPLDTSGEVIWHDHRIHSMTAADTGHAWTVSLLVDGLPTTIHGDLRIDAPPSVLPWVLCIAALLAAGLWIGRRHPNTAALVTAGIAATITLVLAVLITSATPAPLGRDLLPVLLCIGAWLTCITGSLLAGRGRLIATIASAALSAGVLATMLGDLSHAVPMPILGPPILDRILVSVAVASVLSSIVLVVIGAGRPGDVSTAEHGAGPTPITG